MMCVESGLNRLNGYEGVPDGHYKRMQVTVQLHNGEEVEAITYIANPDKVKEKLKPRKKYLSHLLAVRIFYLKLITRNWKKRKR